MQYYNIRIYNTMVHDKNFKRQGLRGRVGLQRGQGLKIVVLQRVGLISKTSVCLRRCFLIMFLQNIPRIVMIIKKITCGSVANRIMVTALLGWTIALGVARMATKVRDCPNMKGQEKGGGQSQAIGLNVDPPNKNHFYSILSMGLHESSPDIITSMVQVFSINVYALLYSGATLSFVTPLITSKFYIFPSIVNDPFMVTLRQVSRWLKRRYRKIFLHCCPIELLVFN